MSRNEPVSHAAAAADKDNSDGCLPSPLPLCLFLVFILKQVLTMF